jgi:hypothetical protein
MFGPWYDPEDDPSISPWPGFDPEHMVPITERILSRRE